MRTWTLGKLACFKEVGGSYCLCCLLLQCLCLLWGIISVSTCFLPPVFWFGNKHLHFRQVQRITTEHALLCSFQSLNEHLHFAELLHAFLKVLLGCNSHTSFTHLKGSSREAQRCTPIIQYVGAKGGVWGQLGHIGSPHHKLNKTRNKIDHTRCVWHIALDFVVPWFCCCGYLFWDVSPVVSLTFNSLSSQGRLSTSDLPVSISQVLRLQACLITLGFLKLR